MKKKILLMALVLCLIAGGNLLAANLLLNPGFETGITGPFTTCTIDNWTKFGSSGWYCSDAGGYHGGVRSVKIFLADANLYQDFSTTAGKVYDVSAWVISLSTDNYGFHGMNAIIEVQWLDSAKTNILSTNIIGYFYGGTFTPPSTNTGGDSRNTWKSISNMATSPAGAFYGRVRLYIVRWATDYFGGSVYWDDVSVTENLYPASDPNPGVGSTVEYSVPLTLSWTRPAPRHPPEIITCDVYFGTDPCMPGTNPKILNKQDANSVYVGTLTVDTNYYWRVDCYDPDGGSEIKTDGMLWTFTTRNQPPTVDAGVKQAVWLASGTATVTMNATVTDDGFPPPGVLTYSWTKVSGSGTPTFSPSNTVKDPNVTFTTADADGYILRLTASDGLTDGDDTVKIRVYAQGYTGLVAYWKLDETSGTTAYDSSGDHHDGTVEGNSVWTTGQVNGAIELDGTGDFVDCGDGDWANQTEEITVSAWIKCIFNKPWQAIVTKGDTSWRLFRDSASGDSNNASFTLNGTGFTPAVSGSTGSVSDNQWHHIVGTYDGVNQCIYVDGILAESHSVTEGSLIDLTNRYVYIGADDDFVEGVRREFKGLIDEVRIYEIGLTAEMVLDQFIADGGHGSCGLTYLPGDINGDCYVNFADFAEMAENWLGCNDVSNSQCQ